MYSVQTYFFLISFFIFTFFSCNKKEKIKNFDVHENISISKPELINYNNANRTIYAESEKDTFIILELEIDTLGSVEEIQIIKPYSNYYDSLAVEIVKKYRYKPAQIFHAKEKSIEKIKLKINVPIYIKSK